MQCQHAPRTTLLVLGEPMPRHSEKMLTNLTRQPSATAAHVACSSLAQPIPIVPFSVLRCLQRFHESICCVRLSRFLDHNQLSFLMFRLRPQESCLNELERTAPLSLADAACCYRIDSQSELHWGSPKNSRSRWGCKASAVVVTAA